VGSPRELVWSAVSLASIPSTITAAPPFMVRTDAALRTPSGDAAPLTPDSVELWMAVAAVVVGVGFEACQLKLRLNTGLHITLPL